MISAPPVLGSYQATQELVVPKSMPMDATCSLTIPVYNASGLRRLGLGSFQRFYLRHHLFGVLSDVVPLGELLLGRLDPGFAFAVVVLRRLGEAGDLRLRLFGLLLGEVPHLLVHGAIQGPEVFVYPAEVPGRKVHVKEMPAYLLKHFRQLLPQLPLGALGLALEDALDPTTHQHREHRDG